MGCGTSILAILASMRGANPVTAWAAVKFIMKSEKILY